MCNQEKHAFNPASFPYIPGSAFAGVVEEAGPLFTTFQKGQAVFGRSTRGTYAEYTTVAVETLDRIFSLREASLAHELSQRGHGRGRIVLHIAG
jgi:hypothetical protein